MNTDIEEKLDLEISDPLQTILDSITEDTSVACIPNEVVPYIFEESIPIPTVVEGDNTYVVVPKQFVSIYGVGLSQARLEIKERALKFNKKLSMQDVAQIRSKYTIQEDAVSELWTYYQDCLQEFAKIFADVDHFTALQSDIAKQVYYYFAKFDVEVYVWISENTKYRPSTYNLNVSCPQSNSLFYPTVEANGVELIKELVKDEKEQNLEISEFKSLINRFKAEEQVNFIMRSVENDLTQKCHTAKNEADVAFNRFKSYTQQHTQHQLQHLGLPKRKEQILNFMRSAHPFVHADIIYVDNVPALVLITPWNIAKSVKQTGGSKMSERLLPPFAFIIKNIFDPIAARKFCIARIVEYRVGEIDYGKSIHQYYTQYKLKTTQSNMIAPLPHALGSGFDGISVVDNKITLTGYGWQYDICVSDAEKFMQNYYKAVASYDTSFNCFAQLLNVVNYDLSDSAGGRAKALAPLSFESGNRILRAAANKDMSINFITDPERVLDTYKLLSPEERLLMEKCFSPNSSLEIRSMYWPNGIKPNLEASVTEEQEDFSDIQ